MVKPTICNSDEKIPVLPEMCDTGLWEVPVNSLSEIKKADRDHAYVLPDDTVWVLSHDGKKFIQLNLATSGDGQPTQIINNDGFIAVKGSGTHNVSIDLDTEKMKGNFQDKLVAGDNIKIEDNVISAIGGSSEEHVTLVSNTDGYLNVEGSGSNDIQIDLNKEQLDKQYQKKIKLATGGLIITERPTNTSLSTNSLNLGTLSHDFSYFIIQSLHFFTIKLRIESAFYFEPKQGSIVRAQNFKNRPQISSVMKHHFYFDVAAKTNPANNGGEYKNYTITGYYEMAKNTEGGSHDFNLTFTGMFDWTADIPFSDDLILKDENNVFSTEYTGTEYELVIRPKTVFL